MSAFNSEELPARTTKKVLDLHKGNSALQTKKTQQLISSLLELTKYVNKLFWQLWEGHNFFFFFSEQFLSPCKH